MSSLIIQWEHTMPEIKLVYIRALNNKYSRMITIFDNIRFCLKSRITIKFTQSHDTYFEKNTKNWKLQFGPLSFELISVASMVSTIVVLEEDISLNFACLCTLTISSQWHSQKFLQFSIELHVFFRYEIVLMDLRITCYTSCWFGKHGNLLILYVPFFYWVDNPFINQNVF